MNTLTTYYLSRAVISVALGGLLALTGSAWWVALLMSLGAFALFLWAPHSGRYAVHPEMGITALRRDERTQAVNDRAARNAFVISMIAVAGITIYFGRISPALVPVTALESVLVLGALAYFLSDLWLRHSS